jgi:hypothetical protein
VSQPAVVASQKHDAANADANAAVNADSARTYRQRPAIVPTPSPVYRPFAGHPPEDLPDWATGYLETLARLGRPHIAANVAGVRPKDVAALAASSQTFAEERRGARAFYLDLVEIRLASSNQVAGQIVTMKSARPRRFLEPALIQQTVAIAQVQGFADIDPRALLREMLAAATPATLAQLADGGVVLDADRAPMGALRALKGLVEDAGEGAAPA